MRASSSLTMSLRFPSKWRHIIIHRLWSPLAVRTPGLAGSYATSWEFLPGPSPIPTSFVLEIKTLTHRIYPRAFYIHAVFNRVSSQACRIMVTRSAFPPLMARSCTMKVIPPIRSFSAAVSALPPGESIARIHKWGIASSCWAGGQGATAYAGQPSHP